MSPRTKSTIISEVLHQRNRSILLTLLGLTAGGVGAGASAYIVANGFCTPDHIGFFACFVLILGWASAALRTIADDRRGRKLDQILQCSDVKTIIDQTTGNMRFERVEMINHSDPENGEPVPTVVARVEISMEEAERIKIALEAAKRHHPLLQLGASDMYDTRVEKTVASVTASANKNEKNSSKPRR